MPATLKFCEECGDQFAITPVESAVIQKVFAPNFPNPEIKKCPACRMRQRLSFRNERSLHRRTCALSGKSIISVYRPDSPYVVYDQNIWWSEQYDPLAYGQEFNFKRPFFAQLAELHRHKLPSAGCVIVIPAGAPIQSIAKHPPAIRSGIAAAAKTFTFCMTHKTSFTPATETITATAPI